MKVSIRTIATKDDIANVRKEIGDVRAQISEASVTSIKWMFLFWVGQLGAMLGVVFSILKK